jgi:integrase
MRVYRPKYTDRHGAVQESGSCACQFKDHDRITRRLSLFRSQKTSDLAASMIQRIVDLRENGQPPDHMANEWLKTAPARIVKRLGLWNILDASRVQTGKPLAVHLVDWKQALTDKGNTTKHVSVSFQRARDVFEGCGWKSIADLKPDAAQRFIADKLGSGPRSRNYYTAAVKAFTRWMVRNRRMPADPFAYLQLIRGKALFSDVRRNRRALTVAECAALLEKTEAGPERWGMSGAQRALLYRVALETGLRAGELYSLKAGSFRLEGKAPCVVLDGGETKNGQAATLPIRPATAERLKAHLADKLPAAVAFTMPPSYDTAEMIRDDLKPAKIVDNPSGRVDFHALRHTFITLLANSGVHPKVAQDLARHSDINLTLSRYSHTVMEQRAEAVAKLPDMEPAGLEAQALEATNGAPTCPDAYGESEAQEPPSEAKTGAIEGENGSDLAKTEGCKNTTASGQATCENGRKVLNPLRLPVPPLRHSRSAGKIVQQNPRFKARNPSTVSIPQE